MPDTILKSNVYVIGIYPSFAVCNYKIAFRKITYHSGFFQCSNSRGDDPFKEIFKIERNKKRFAALLRA